MKYAGAVLIMSGIVVVLVGALLYCGCNLSWLGKLPGDIRVVRPGYSFYFPITTSLVVSAVISLVLFLMRIFR